MKFTVLYKYGTDTYMHFVKAKNEGYFFGIELRKLDAIDGETGPLYAFRCKGNIVQYMRMKHIAKNKAQVIKGW